MKAKRNSNTLYNRSLDASIDKKIARYNILFHKFEAWNIGKTFVKSPTAFSGVTKKTYNITEVSMFLFN